MLAIISVVGSTPKLRQTLATKKSARLEPGTEDRLCLLACRQARASCAAESLAYRGTRVL
jgi:hypothetical protein